MQHTISQSLFFKLRKVGNSLTRFQSHANYLERCNSNLFISKGFLRQSNVTNYHKNLQSKCQQKQDHSSRKIQKEAMIWLKNKVSMIKKDFNNIKCHQIEQRDFHLISNKR